MIAKMLSAALILGSLAMGTGVANADPNPPDPNFFGYLTLNAPEPAPAGGQDRTGELERGLLDGLTGQRPNPGLAA